MLLCFCFCFCCWCFVFAPGIRIPLISFGATSIELSDKTVHPYFFRTCSNDINQGIVARDIVDRFNWSKVRLQSEPVLWYTQLSALQVAVPSFFCYKTAHLLISNMIENGNHVYACEQSGLCGVWEAKLLSWRQEFFGISALIWSWVSWARMVGTFRITVIRAWGCQWSACV